MVKESKNSNSNKQNPPTENKKRGENYLGLAKKKTKNKMEEASKIEREKDMKHEDVGMAVEGNDLGLEFVPQCGLDRKQAADCEVLAVVSIHGLRLSPNFPKRF